MCANTSTPRALTGDSGAEGDEITVAIEANTWESIQRDRSAHNDGPVSAISYNSAEEIAPDLYAVNALLEALPSPPHNSPSGTVAATAVTSPALRLVNSAIYENVMYLEPTVLAGVEGMEVENTTEQEHGLTASGMEIPSTMYQGQILPGPTDQPTAEERYIAKRVAFQMLDRAFADIERIAEDEAKSMEVPWGIEMDEDVRLRTCYVQLLIEARASSSGFNRALKVYRV